MSQDKYVELLLILGHTAPLKGIIIIISKFNHSLVPKNEAFIQSFKKVFAPFFQKISNTKKWILIVKNINFGAHRISSYTQMQISLIIGWVQTCC